VKFVGLQFEDVGHQNLATVTEFNEVFDEFATPGGIVIEVN
jgi:hypothetical protein